MMIGARVLEPDHPLLSRDSVHLLGEIAQVDETIIESLWRGLLDENNTVRTTCVEALAQLGRRFPGTAVSISSKLVQAIEDPQFDKPDNKMRSAHEYAYNGLWLMVVSGEVLVEEY